MVANGYVRIHVGSEKFKDIEPHPHNLYISSRIVCQTVHKLYIH